MDPVWVTGVWRCACSATSSPTKAQTQAASVEARIHPTSCSHAHLRMLARCSQPMLDIGCSTYVRMYIGFGVSGRKGGGIQAPGFRPPDSGPRIQAPGPRIQAPGFRPQAPGSNPQGGLSSLGLNAALCVRTYARMYMRTRVEGPGSWVGYALFVGSHWFLLSVC